MATTTVLHVTLPQTAAQLDRLSQCKTAKEFGQQLENLLFRALGGTVPGNVSIKAGVGQPNGVQASGTVKCTSVIATDAVKIGTITLTAVANAATPTAVQFRIGTSDTTCAANLAAAINANTTLKTIVSATSATDTVTVTALQPGVLGNHVAVAQTSGNTMTISGSGFLASGAGANAALTTYTFS